MEHKKKWTPVPWLKNHVAGLIETAAGLKIFIAGYGFTPEEINANLDLAAAAPELVEALEGMIERKVQEYCRNAVHPSGRFCTVCGVNSETDVHHSKCPVKVAEDVLSKVYGERS